MALFKNLYLDLSYLNPFKKSQKKQKVNVQQNKIQNDFNQQIYFEPSKNLPSNLELPNVSKRLLNPSIEKELPKIENIQKEHLIQKNEAKDIKETNDIKKVNENIVMPPPMLAESIKNGINLNNFNANESNYSNLPSKIESSFFSDIYSHLTSDEKIISKNISNKLYKPNLMDEMQTFWSLKKEEISNLKINSALKSDILKKLNDLQKHETDWQLLQLEKERINDALFSKEILIENQINYIKKSFKKLHLSSNVPSNNEFILPDGSKLSSINELIIALKTMNDEFFYYHVNDQKNDFFNWIKDVYGFNDLAEQIKEIKNKEQMANLIEKWANYA